MSIALVDVRGLIRPIAHRGLHNSADGIIENTESSVRAAIESGYGIEVDIQPVDGFQPIVFHDRRLHRLTNGQGPVRERSLDYVKSLNMKQGLDRILELRELLEIVDGRAPLLLEIKSDWRGGSDFENNIVKCIVDYKGALGFMSFDPFCVRAIGVQVPDIPRGLVAGGLRGRRGVPVPGYLKRMALRHLLSIVIARPDYIAYDIRALPRLAPIVANRLFGLPLFTWTVRSASQQEKAKKWTDAMIFEGFRPEV